MKVLLLCCVLILNISVAAQQPFTNADVISLSKSGLSAEVIAAKIKQTGGDFDTTPAALKQLKASGVSETVILAMIEAAPAKATEKGQPTQLSQPNSPNSLTLKDGTPVELELAYTVSSADLKEGDAVSFRVVQPIQVAGVTVIERGAPATARVVKAEGGKSWGRGGNLTWAIQNVTTVDNQKVPLNYSAGTKGNGAPGTMTTGIVLTSLVFWPAAPLWGFKKGKPAVIPAGKRFEVFVHGDAVIDASQAQTATPAQSRQPNSPETTGKPCYQNGRKVPCS
ncbi:MAG TPA: hypothetical protein PLD20_13330 [Blastocatellia bacterium]|nr:hypothetical protein [Blastocatellia bacterium]HMV82518.1 hypothetical protein [Blastocatellia bacterium]HMX24668.1 hypothetical protein [Blastocatellia bacterium]HMY76034.1 hypothetical protein [Blastocatellia bacterium]HMZ18912.1 hypothetical protein [Blastocatellia bacterium]